MDLLQLLIIEWIPIASCGAPEGEFLLLTVLECLFVNGVVHKLPWERCAPQCVFRVPNAVFKISRGFSMYAYQTISTSSGGRENFGLVSSPSPSPEKRDTESDDEVADELSKF